MEPEHVKELLEALEDMVCQHCTVQNDDKTTYLDSMALSANAFAMRLLEDHGRIIVDKSHGRRVIGHWRST